MSEKTLIEPDLAFINQIVQNGGDSVKKCFQCATCSVVCNLSQDNKPFPRKEMIAAQWGLKDKLVNSPDIWLCHQCGDCTSYCPRGAKPADVLASIRRYAVSHFAFPNFISKMISDPKYLSLLFIFPIVLLLAYFYLIGHLNIPGQEEVEYAKFFPHLYLNIFFSSAAGLAAIAALVSLVRFWSGISKYNGNSGPKGDIIKAIYETVMEILKHKKFTDCSENKFRYLGHLGIFYGFIGLFIVTAIAVVLIFIEMYITTRLYPLELLHPAKILGNISAIILFLGCSIIIYNRLKLKEDLTSTYFDWYFLIVLYLVTITGIFTEALRFWNIPNIAYPMYFVHLVFVFNLLIYFPYSKFAHIMYRTVAIFFDKYVRNSLNQEKKACEQLGIKKN